MTTICKDSWLADSDVHEANILALLAGRKYKLAVDVGAHCGLWTMRLAQMSEYVISFEPEPRAFHTLAANCARFDNVVLHDWAVGEKSRPAQLFFPIETGNSSQSSIDGMNPTIPHAVAFEQITVPMVRLTDVMMSPDFIKVDVEGYELQVMDGAGEMFRHADFVIECHTEHTLSVVLSRFPEAVVHTYNYNETAKYAVRFK